MPRLRLGRGRTALSGAPAFVSFPAPSAAVFSFAAPATIDASFQDNRNCNLSAALFSDRRPNSSRFYCDRMSRSFSFSCNAASRWAMATLRSSASATLFRRDLLDDRRRFDELLLEKQRIGRQIIEANHAQMATQKSRESPANSRVLSSS